MKGARASVILHVNALGELVKLRGGFHGLSVSFLNLLLSTSSITFIVYSTPPIRPPTFESGNLDAGATIAHAAATFPELRELGVAFFDPTVADFLDGELLRSVRDMSHWITYREYCLACDRHASPSETTHFHGKLWNALFRICNSLHQQGSSMDGRQEVCQIVLLICCMPGVELNGPGSALYRAFSARLTSAFRRVDLIAFWKTAPHVLLWTCLFGAAISRGLPEYPWFVANMSIGVKLTGATAWVDMRKVLLRLFYLERVDGEILRNIWQEAKVHAQSSYDLVQMI